MQKGTLWECVGVGDTLHISESRTWVQRVGSRHLVLRYEDREGGTMTMTTITFESREECDGALADLRSRYAESAPQTS